MAHPSAPPRSSLRMVAVTTARLRGRPIGPADLADLRLLHADHRVTATLTIDGEPIPEDRSRGFLARAAAHWEAHGFGIWGFHDEGGFVGYCGLRHFLVEGTAEVELLYALGADHWRKGLGSEMA